MDKTKAETYKLGHLSKKELIAVVYTRYGKKLYAYAIRNWSLNEDTAWDLVYKTLYKVIASYANYSFESEEKFASFIFRIFINYLRNHYRDSKKQSETALIDKDELAGIPEPAETETARNPKLVLLDSILESMEDWQRMLLLMRSEGRPYSEIAAYIGKPEAQLKVYYQRLKEQLTKKFNEHEPAYR